MSVATLKAHYDGKHICLDEPIDLPPNTPVIVAIPETDAEAKDRAEWFAFARAAFARAYGEDKADYSNPVILERPSKRRKAALFWRRSRRLTGGRTSSSFV